MTAAGLRGRDQRGSVTPFAVACLGLLVLLGAALGVVAAMVVAHRSAQSAADLASLAAASALARSDDGCAAGATVAAANGARLTACSAEGLQATVTVEVDGPHWLGQESDLQARARAGPAGGPGSG